MRGLIFVRGRKLLHLSLLQCQRRMLHVCIVGSGPAGFYTAEKMLKADEKGQVDILDRLPTPFGLVRSGVAPDHPETKIVVNQFSRVAANERCSFFGNVSLGNDVSLPELRRIYDIVVLAYVAESDRSLGVPGEDLGGICSTREFVWWYNGHLDCLNMEPDLKSTDTVVVLGQGNVALDVARILLRPTIELSTTNISSHALTALQESAIKKLYLVGRRGPAQTACTAKELREILGATDLNVYIQEDDLVTSPKDEVASILEDVEKGLSTQSQKPGRQGLLQLLEHKSIRFVPFSGWEKIDAKEKMEGHMRNKPREKITSKEELLQVANG